MKQIEMEEVVANKEGKVHQEPLVVVLMATPAVVITPLRNKKSYKPDNPKML
jgi:hypothetical protein